MSTKKESEFNFLFRYQLAYIIHVQNFTFRANTQYVFDTVSYRIVYSKSVTQALRYTFGEFYFQFNQNKFLKQKHTQHEYQ